MGFLLFSFLYVRLVLEPEGAPHPQSQAPDHSCTPCVYGHADSVTCTWALLNGLHGQRPTADTNVTVMSAGTDN